MKFSINSNVLSEALDIVSGALSNKPKSDIWKCVHLHRLGDTLQLRTMDSELGFSIRHTLSMDFSSEPDEDLDQIAVPAQHFLEACRALPDVPITFEARQDYSIVLEHENGRYVWMGYNGTQFPDFPLISEEESVTIDRRRLKQAWDLVGFAASKDSSRIGMMGFYLEIEKDVVRGITTDGHRLAMCALKGVDNDTNATALIPLKVFQQATRIAGEDECTIQTNKDSISFSFGATCLVSTLIDAKFPNYRRVIPTSNDKVVHLRKDDLYNSVRRVNIFASRASHQVILDCKEAEVEVSAHDPERSSKGRERIHCEYLGDRMQIGFNATYLQESLRYVPAEDINLALGTPSRAALITPVEQDESFECTILIMPVMLNTFQP